MPEEIPNNISFEVNENTPLKVIDMNGKPFSFRDILFDLDTMRQIFVNEEYRLPINNFQPKLILDCGSNIGCSAVYFALKYPGAQIYCVEPQKDNFALLKMNTQYYPNVHLVQSALWGF